ncbi:hypothetical protein OSB04_011610 [Centaurea solstitialis]|uniref:Retrotransposon gag domain-containing protein n=1 Tax=Centaurea solstitialis TaxID=347529 RepID=A0AA38TMW4_9ASTR|nr:hypothetical protein OSB04_011610 [Centaurea solstitialis]
MRSLQNRKCLGRAIRLRLFPFTLIGEAKAWLRSLEPSSITTWENLRAKFTLCFFPPSKIKKLRVDIHTFRPEDDEAISEARERFKHLMNSCPSHGLSKSEQVQTFYSGLNYPSRCTLDSSADGLFMYKTPTQGYKLLDDTLIHKIDWKSDRCLHVPKFARKVSTDFDQTDEIAAMKNKQVGCEECNGPHLTKNCPNKPMMTPEEVNFLNRGEYQGRWNNNRNFNQRPPGFFAPNQQNQPRAEGKSQPRTFLEELVSQFIGSKKKINEEKNSWTDIYKKEYVPSDSDSAPDYATDYDSDFSEGLTFTLDDLTLRDPIYLNNEDKEEEEEHKQGDYAKLVIPPKDKGKGKLEEKNEREHVSKCTYIFPIKEDPWSYSLPISIKGKFTGLALIDIGAALNMMHVGYCKKSGVKKLTPTSYQYRGINGYMTRPLGNAEGVPIRIGNFIYPTDFIVTDLPKNTEIPIILGRAFLHTAQVNVDMCNQVTSMGYGDTRMFFDPDGKSVSHLREPYDDPAQSFKTKFGHLLPHARPKTTEAVAKPRQRTASTSASAINYRAPDGSHAFTYFMNDPTLNKNQNTELCDTLNRIASRQIVILRRADWELLQTLGVDNRVRAILDKHAMGENGQEYFIYNACDRVFRIDEPLYRELILEFVTSFVFDANKAIIDCHEPCMTFRLGGIWRTLSLANFVTTELLEPFEEPEREFRKKNKQKSKANKVRPRALNFEMGDEAPMWTTRRAAPTVPTNPITKPDLNKEIPRKLLHMIKDLTFDGKNGSNPIVHMENFVDICDLFKTEEGRDDAIRLRVFHLTLTGEARAWLRSLEPSSITTWEGLRSKFLSRFFPPSKIDKLRADIRSFQQDDGEKNIRSMGTFQTPSKFVPESRIELEDGQALANPRMAGKISTDFDPSDELAAMKNQKVKFERKIEELIKSVHALQVGCEECNGPHLTKDCPNRPMMTPEEVNYLNRGDYQGRWNNNRNFIPRPPSFFAPNQQTQRTDGEPRVSIEDRLLQFMDAQKKLNDEVGSYLRNHQSTIQNLELQVGRVSQLLSERTQGELPTQTQVNPKVENAKPMLMMTGEPSKKKWTDIYTKKDDEEEDGKQGGYAEFVIPKKEDKGKEKEKEKAAEDELLYIAPIKHDPGSYNLPISCFKFKGLALIDSGAALNMMPVGYCRKMGVKKIVTTDYQYRGVNGYMTKPLGIAEGVPIRIGNFVYYTDFIIANLQKDMEIPIILGRDFLHTAQVNTDMRNQVSSLGYGDKRIYFDPNREPVTHLDEPYEDPSQAYKKNTNRPLLPHEHVKQTEDYPNPIHQKDQTLNGSGPSKKENRKKKGSSARHNHTEEMEAKIEQIRHAMKVFKKWKQKTLRDRQFLSLAMRSQPSLRQRTRSSTSTAPTFRAQDVSHVFTYFMNDPTLNAPKREEYRDTVNRLIARQVLVPRRVDWNLLRSMGVENDIKAILEKHAYDEDGTEYYICRAWERVFDIAETLYRELIIEFVANFRFDAGKALQEFYQSCMTFRLGGVWRSLSLVEFVVALGIYTQDEVDAPGFVEYMWATAKRQHGFDPQLAWAILGDGDYGSNLKVKGFLASSDRLLHRMLIHAVNAHSSSEEKVSTYDLWLLEQLSTDDKYPNAQGKWLSRGESIGWWPIRYASS